MTYGTVHGRPYRTPEQKLLSRAWRWRHSAWLLAPVLGFGVFSAAGFVYIAARAKRPAWWLAAGVYAALGLTGTVLADASDGGSFAGGILVLTWGASIVHGIVVNPQYLRWRAAHGPWYAQRVEPAPQPAGPVPHAARAWPAGPAGSSAWAAPPAPDRDRRGPLDLNTATAQELSRLPGVDPWLTHRILSARMAHGPFRDLEDFVRCTGLVREQAERIAPHVVVDPPPRLGPGR